MLFCLRLSLLVYKGDYNWHNQNNFTSERNTTIFGAMAELPSVNHVFMVHTMQKFRSCKQWCVLRLWSYYKTGLRPAEWSWSGWNGLVLRSWPCWDGLGLVVLCSWSSLCETVFCGRSDIACSHCRCRRDKTVLSAAWTSQYVTRSSATAKIARDADVGSHSLSLLSNLSPVYNLHPLNSLHYTALLTYHY